MVALSWTYVVCACKNSQGKRTIEIFQKRPSTIGSHFLKGLLEVEWRKAVNSIDHFVHSMCIFTTWNMMQPKKPHQKLKKKNKNQPKAWLPSRVRARSGLQTYLEEWAVWSNILNCSHKDGFINSSEKGYFVLPLHKDGHRKLGMCCRHKDALLRLLLKAGHASSCGGVSRGGFPDEDSCRVCLSRREQLCLSLQSSQAGLHLVTICKKETTSPAASARCVVTGGPRCHAQALPRPDFN